MFAAALVRVNRGSTWITVAPRSRACITQRKATGWHSSLFDPWMTIQSAFAKSWSAVVAPPLPNEAPRPGTVEECQIRA